MIDSNIGKKNILSFWQRLVENLTLRGGGMLYFFFGAKQRLQTSAKEKEREKYVIFAMCNPFKSFGLHLLLRLTLALVTSLFSLGSGSCTG